MVTVSPGQQPGYQLVGRYGRAWMQYTKSAIWST